MLHGDAFGLFVGAAALGAVHGIEPGHGWPVAASYALDQTNNWAYGLAASLIIGVGHLISSFAMVGVFFYAKGYFSLTQVDEPVTILRGIQIGGPVSLLAGSLLLWLGVREYFHGYSHGSHTSDAHSNPHSHDHQGPDEHSAHPHEQDRSHNQSGLIARLKKLIPSVVGHSHSHDDHEATTDRGLLGIAWFAFVLGFAHEEEFEIIAICAGSNYCLELMSVYALAVIAGIVGLTMLLIAGYHHSKETVEQYTPYLPVFSAAVLIVMGLGFITGVL
ncbi:MAG: hypothetical protein J07HX5_00432 [halophilic archaeon J07HX5]|jgi:hypothetical protein|nr:MAG: hypothetical protein J07HX5_00432 [halophilic archaeon J07HX5]